MSQCEEMKMKYPVGDLLIPKRLEMMKQLSLIGKRFVAPNTVDLRDYCSRTRDQGNKPWCAAYAAAGFASNILWRKNDYPEDIDAASIYGYAKCHDESPNSNGTTLDAALDALLEFKYFSRELCSIRMLRNTTQVKYAIHKFGCCLLGMIVTNEWYYCGSRKSTIAGKKHSENLGGHAVLCCGYNRDGVIIQNSWGERWGQYGFALVTWEEFEREFSYGAVIDNCLYDMKMN